MDRVGRDGRCTGRSRGGTLPERVVDEIPGVGHSMSNPVPVSPPFEGVLLKRSVVDDWNGSSFRPVSDDSRQSRRTDTSRRSRVAHRPETGPREVVVSPFSPTHQSRARCRMTTGR